MLPSPPIRPPAMTKTFLFLAIAAAGGSLIGTASAQSSWTVNAVAPADANYIVASDWLAAGWTAGVPDAEGAIATLNHDSAPGVAGNARTATFGLGGTTAVTVGSLSLNSTRQTSGNTFAIRVGTANTQNLIFNGAGSGNATLNTVGSPSGTQNGIIAAVTLDSNLDITGASSIMFGSAIVGNGYTITKSNSGAANFAGFTGAVNIYAGTASGTTSLGSAGSGLVVNLTGNTLVNHTGASVAGINSTVTSQFNGNSAGRDLTLAGAGTYSTIATIGANTDNINKTGSGTQAFTGTVSNVNTILVTNGKLIIDGSLTNAAAATTVTSNATQTATLAGHGTVQAVTLSGGAGFGGVLDVSNSSNSDLGDLAATSLLWNGTDTAFSQMKFDLSGTSTASDQLLLSGAMTRGATGSSFQFDFGNTGGAGFTYTLITATGGFSGSGFTDASAFSYTGLGAGLTGSFSINGNDLQFVVVPEPSTLAAVTVALMGLVLWPMVRRRFS